MHVLQLIRNTLVSCPTLSGTFATDTPHNFVKNSILLSNRVRSALNLFVFGLRVDQLWKGRASLRPQLRFPTHDQFFLTLGHSPLIVALVALGRLSADRMHPKLYHVANRSN